MTICSKETFTLKSAHDLYLYMVYAWGSTHYRSSSRFSLSATRLKGLWSMPLPVLMVSEVYFSVFLSSAPHFPLFIDRGMTCRSLLCCVEGLLLVRLFGGTAAFTAIASDLPACIPLPSIKIFHIYILYVSLIKNKIKIYC